MENILDADSLFRQYGPKQESNDITCVHISVWRKK
jgi:hypothetical protein